MGGIESREQFTIGQMVLCHRRDYHEDGSKSDYYYVEVTRDIFLAIGGEELSEKGTWQQEEAK
jgi:hypothetical protein